MLGLLLVLAAAAFFIYRYYERERSHWSRRGIPGPPPQWLWGNVWDLVKYEEPRSLVLRDWTKQYGKKFAMQDQHSQSPRTHIVEAWGSHWRRLRALGSPAFSNNSLKQVLPVVEDSASKMIALLEESANCKKGNVNMLEFFQEYTLDIVCKLALGKKDVKMCANPYMQIVRDVFVSPMNTPDNMLPMLFPFAVTPWLVFIETVGRFFAFLKLMSDLEHDVGERKKERAAGKASSHDFIDMFLDAEVDVSELIYDDDDKTTISRRLSYDEVVGQCLVFLLAGFETTANSLAYISFFLATHPDVQERLRDEIDAVCEDDDISFEQLADSFIVSRECMKSTTVGGMAIEKGTFIYTDTWSMLMDEAVWGEDAKEFRWLDVSTATVPRVAFQAFGEGIKMALRCLQPIAEASGRHDIERVLAVSEHAILWRLRFSHRKPGDRFDVNRRDVFPVESLRHLTNARVPYYSRNVFPPIIMTCDLFITPLAGQTSFETLKFMTKYEEGFKVE